MWGGGSPCQSISSLNIKGEGLDGKSGLFFEYIRVLKEINPTYFILENVRPNKQIKQTMDSYMGVEGVLINSALVSYQIRNRYYWTNINIKPIVDKHISFQDYKEENYDSKLVVTRTPYHEEIIRNTLLNKHTLRMCYIIDKEDKIHCIKAVSSLSLANVVKVGDWVRKLTRRELELAQTLPVGYTDLLSYNLAQKAIGNGWTVDVIAHILRCINE